MNDVIPDLGRISRRPHVQKGAPALSALVRSLDENRLLSVVDGQIDPNAIMSAEDLVEMIQQAVCAELTAHLGQHPA